MSTSTKAKNIIMLVLILIGIAGFGCGITLESPVIGITGIVIGSIGVLCYAWRCFRWFFRWWFSAPRLARGATSGASLFLLMMILAAPQQWGDSGLRVVIEPIWCSGKGAFRGLNFSIVMAYALVALAFGSLCAFVGRSSSEQK